jgi:hypothetical protein
MTTNRTHFAHRIDKVDEAGGALEHLAGAEDSGLADAVYRAARKRWPDDAIMLRHEARVIRDSRQETPPEAADDQIDRRAPLGYLNYAASYHAAADLVYSEEIEATHPDAPATFLYCQAAELYLKAIPPAERRLLHAALVDEARPRETGIASGEARASPRRGGENRAGLDGGDQSVGKCPLPQDGPQFAPARKSDPERMLDP